jgi:hypothetical protein
MGRTACTESQCLYKGALFKVISYAELEVFSPVKFVISGCIFTLVILHTKRI